MTQFILCLVGFGLMAIPCIIFVWLGTDKLKGRIIGTVIVIIFWFAFSFGVWSEAKYNSMIWNGGYCDCGEHWELRGASKSKMGTETKYYACPNCHTEIEITEG